MLYFYYGVMGSSKTAQLLMQRYNYQQLGLKVALVKPEVDTRAGVRMVYSRVGLKAEAEIVVGPTHSIREQPLWLAAQNAHSSYQYVFIDEAQFLTDLQVEELAELSDYLDIFCYGLKTDFRGQFFPGSAALLRLAEIIEEVPGGLCWCGKKATMNTRVDAQGSVIKEGQQVLIDDNSVIKYIGLCYEHWRKGISHA
ncbi:MAG: thymidine kinase [Clostridiales bacterium]|nr:thymidine kinase [Clostridiales bacterium]